MTKAEYAIIELQKLIAFLKSDSQQNTAAAGSRDAPALSAAGADSLNPWKKAKVTFYDVKTSQTERGTWTRGRIGLGWVENGESKSEFADIPEKLLMRVDGTFEKGSRVEYLAAKNKKGFLELLDLRITG